MFPFNACERAYSRLDDQLPAELMEALGLLISSSRVISTILVSFVKTVVIRWSKLLTEGAILQIKALRDSSVHI